MAPGYDFAVMSLLCSEDNVSFMGFEEGGDCDDVGGGDDCVDGTGEGSFCVDLFLEEAVNMARAPLLSDECLRTLIEKESEHLPRDDYVVRLRSGGLDLSARQDAVDWILKVHGYFGFGPLCAYLSISYLDRFLSAYELPQGKSWMMQLLSVACLSLAAKMEEIEVPLVINLQVGETKFIFESKTIQRMELLVLSTLNWRMQAITPFSYVDYFLQKINDGNPPSRRAINQLFQVILCTIQGCEFLEFRPSEIAAAVAIFFVGKTHQINFDQAITYLQYVDKEAVLSCYELIQGLALTQRGGKCVDVSVILVPQSPIGVLDATCLSYKSDDMTIGSCASSHNTPSPKRRRLNLMSDKN